MVRLGCERSGVNSGAISLVTQDDCFLNFLNLQLLGIISLVEYMESNVNLAKVCILENNRDFVLFCWLGRRDLQAKAGSMLFVFVL